MRSSGAMPMIARSGSSGAATVVTSTSTWVSPPAGRSTVRVWVAPGPPAWRSSPTSPGSSTGVAVDGDDHVVRLEHLRGRRVRRDLAHDRAGGGDLDVLAEVLQRDRDRGELRRVHQLRVVAAVLGLGPVAAHPVLGQHVDVVVEPAGQRLEHVDGADAHRRERDRLLGREALGVPPRSLLGDRPDRARAQRDVRDLEHGRAGDGARRAAPTATTKRSSGGDEVGAGRDRPPAQTRARREPAVASATSVVREGPDSSRAAGGCAADVQTTEATEEDRRPWWLRVRAVAGLSVLVVVLGVARGRDARAGRADVGGAARPRAGMTRPGGPSA